MEKKVSVERVETKNPFTQAPIRSLDSFAPGKERMELCEAVRLKVNPQRKELVLVYPASGVDLANPLLAADPTLLIFIDSRSLAKDLLDEIRRIGGNVNNLSQSGNRLEVNFEWERRERKLIFRQLEIGKDTLKELSEEIKGGYDVYFEKLTGGTGEYTVREIFIRNLRKGGFSISDAGMGESLGFEAIQLEKKFSEVPYRFGYSPLTLQLKTADMPAVKEILDFNEQLLGLEWLRNGALMGIVGEKAEKSLSYYRERLTKLRDFVRSGVFPPDVRKELEKRTVDKLYDAPGDMSKVWNSMEAEVRHQDSLRYIAGGKLLPRDEEELEEKIKAMESSVDRPTREQLERYIERGREIFREVWNQQ